MKDIEGIPEGWKLVRIGAVHKNEYYLDHNGDPCKRIGGQSDCVNCPIIEKEHKEPELVWMLSMLRKPVAAINEEDRAVKKLNGTSILEDVTYDRILTIDGDGEEWMYLGHWNDGVRGDA